MAVALRNKIPKCDSSFYNCCINLLWVNLRLISFNKKESMTVYFNLISNSSSTCTEIDLFYTIFGVNSCLIQSICEEPQIISYWI